MLLSQVKGKTINVTIDGHCITNCKNLKLLGVTVDSDLTFRPHIQEICKNASKEIGVLSRLKNLLSTNTKLHLYKYAILPVLTYCHLAWNFCTKSDRRKLERIQERALRIVLKKKLLHMMNYLRKLDQLLCTTEGYKIWQY